MVFIYLWVTEDKYMEQLWAMEIRQSVDTIKEKRKRLLEKENRKIKQEDNASDWCKEWDLGSMEDGVNSLCPGWSLWRGSPEPEHPSCFEKL